MNSSYITKYIKENIRRFEFKMSKKTDKELIEWLEAQPNKNEYIKSLILADKKRGTK